MEQTSNIGNLADLKEGEVLLPAYLQRMADGVYVDLALFPVGGGFVQFIDQMFGGGSRFRELDYALFQNLLFDYDAVLDAHGIDAKLRLAADVVVFDPKRKPLYRAVKIDTQFRHAEYFFEPVSIDVVTETPVYGEPDPDGVAAVISTTRSVESQPTQLDIDEFIADMWLKGVRFGVAVEAVAGVIARRETVRMEIATQLDPTEGIDAEIEEACSVLHRDNSPKILFNGKADLRRFQNRFPQIEMGARLLKKKPRVLGKPGYKVNGQIQEPEIPKDIDLFALAGLGTFVDKQQDGEFILSKQDGFLSIDTATNSISVTEKIENKGGISIKTTGDLVLSGNEFIEHGEVQEGRVVEGKSMTFRSAVYGDIISQGGLILFESNLSNGSAKSNGGDITANGRCFNSYIEAWEGKVSLKYAESCVIFGESVQIERAINCEIIANEVRIDNVEGCAIASKEVHIELSDSCRGKQTVISMLQPDLSGVDAQMKLVREAITGCEKAIAMRDQGIEQIKADPEVARYLVLAASIQKGAAKLTDAHEENWRKMTIRFAKVDDALRKLNADKQVQIDKMAGLQQEYAQLLELRGKNGVGVSCTITSVVGDTLVRGVAAQNGAAEFRKVKISDIKVKLREQGKQNDRIFCNSTGSLEWSYAVPEVDVAS